MNKNISAEVLEEMLHKFEEEGTDNQILFTGLASEVGEVMSERMKEVRKGIDRTAEIKDELSDVLWFVSMIAKKRGYTLRDLMLHNINKLEDRIINGK
jgi:NTP pyrophosphatase (non-canonical NTP hydrolase)